MRLISTKGQNDIAQLCQALVNEFRFVQLSPGDLGTCNSLRAGQVDEIQASCPLIPWISIQHPHGHHNQGVRSTWTCIQSCSSGWSVLLTNFDECLKIFYWTHSRSLYSTNFGSSFGVGADLNLAVCFGGVEEISEKKDWLLRTICFLPDLLVVNLDNRTSNLTFQAILLCFK
jgi:hypothetical protein